MSPRPARLSRALLPFAAALACATGALSQDATRPMNASNAPSPGRLEYAPAEDRPLDEWLRLRAREAGLGSAGFELVAPEMIFAAPIVGRYADALRYDDVGHTPRPSVRDVAHALDGHAPVDALDAVTRAAAGRQVVFVNEAHPVPQHRAFTLQLLARLRAEGFEWFAAETISGRDTALSARGYAVPETGPYMAEPVYGDLVRTALRLGFRVVSYEAPLGVDLDPRERAQAANLVERILAENPSARIVVHAGYGHITKAVPPGALVPMAVRFRELTGIDPLAVEQTIMSEHSRPEMEDALYRRVADSGALTRPTVFVGEDGRPWSPNRTQYDVMVFTPRTVYEHGRPTWLRMGGLRAPFALPDDVCGAAPACLVRARPEGETARAIPIDQVAVLRGEPVPALMLPPGRFRVTVEGPGSVVLREIRAEMPRPRT